MARYNRPMQIHMPAFAALIVSMAALSPAHAAKPAPALPLLAVAAPPPFVPRFARIARDAEPVSFDACDKPRYPDDALRADQAGKVDVRFKIAADGSVLKKFIGRSSGFPKLDSAALDPDLNCKFRPASINGKPVRGNGGIGFTFSY